MHAFDFILVLFLFVFAAAVTHVLLAKPCHAHVLVKPVARVTSLVSPYAPASASIMYPSYGLPHGGVILHRGLWERKKDEGSRNGCEATAGLSIKK